MTVHNPYSDRLDMDQATGPADEAPEKVTLSFEQLLAFAKDMVSHAIEDVTYETPEDVQESVLQTLGRHDLAKVVGCERDDTCLCDDPSNCTGYWAFSPLLSSAIRAARTEREA
jgi:hypothetical protein